MFSGIIKYLGKLQKKEDNLFTFEAPNSLCQKLDQGTSIAVNGICLTVLIKTGNSFTVEVMPETLNRTMLINLKKDDIVNLELPVTPKTFLSGQIIQGHIDGIGKVLKVVEDKNGKILEFSVPINLSRYIVEKGSIAVNGVSLTVIDTEKDCFTVGIIPFTWNNTMFHTLNLGDLVNIEVDILAKYMEKLI